MKLGANSVLFGGYDMETSFKYLAMAGYDGIEISKGAKINGKMIANTNAKESGKSGFFKKMVNGSDESFSAKQTTA